MQVKKGKVKNSTTNKILMNWFEIKNVKEILSPALALYPERIAHNIEQMIEIAGDVNRLRPHIKTYKMPQIIHMQMDRGIKKFKCATIVEARMLAEAGAPDILLAMPTIGPAQSAYLALSEEYKNVDFSVLIDDVNQIESWLKKLKNQDRIDFFIDINVGMNRTGIDPEGALLLIEKIRESSQCHLKGLHVYDGHIRITDFNDRLAECEKGYAQISNLLQNIPNAERLEIVCGGSVTFSCHAKDSRRNLSPGTTLLWDAGYGTNFPDIPMLNAAMLITRIISKPQKNRICLDLGHKSVGSEMQGVRVLFPEIENYKRVGHSEEHLVLEVDNPEKYEIGDVLYGIPWHICPTVALHEQAVIIENHEIIDHWDVAARHRQYQL